MVDPNSIAVGNCYVTSTQQVRKVLEISDDHRLKYVSRGKKPTPNWENGSFTWVSRDVFADDVDRQVTCDWDPDYAERGPN